MTTRLKKKEQINHRTNTSLKRKDINKANTEENILIEKKKKHWQSRYYSDIFIKTCCKTTFYRRLTNLMIKFIQLEKS